MSSLISGLTHLCGWVAYALIAALVFGETAIFLGFVLPGETAAVLGGVLASRGHLSLALLLVVVSRGDPARSWDTRSAGARAIACSRPAAAPHSRRGGAGPRRPARPGRSAVMAGRFVAVVRALMPAAAGASKMSYRTFLIYNVVGGVVWGVGYCLLGYLAGSAYAVVERRVGTGLAIALAVVVLAAVIAWVVRRHRRLSADRSA